jgi:hypothetical protein
MYSDQKFIGSKFWRLASPISRCQRLVKAFLLFCYMAGSGKVREKGVGKVTLYNSINSIHKGRPSFLQ